MIETPWGRSDTLRERRLRPGPGMDPEEVARNQRARLFGAMVASVNERGYTATRLSDLTELSGVSGNSFYSLFADKEACFVAAMEEMLGWALATLVIAPGRWEDQVRQAAVAFVELFVAQPAAARMCLLEAHAVGPAGLAPFERATERFEAFARRAAADSPQMIGVPPELLSAVVGALIELARARVRSGSEAELPGLVDGFVELVMLLRPPPQALRLSTRPPVPPPETIEAHDHSERALRALAAVVAERGYANATITEIVNRASMSPTTFYAHFEGKEDALMAAIDRGGARLVAAFLPAFRRGHGWTQGVRAAFGAYFNFLAAQPSLAQLLMVEVYAAGPEAIARREAALRPLELLLAEGRARFPEVPAIAQEAIPGGIFALTYKQLRKGGAESLPSLAPTCTYLTLVPFIGQELACAAANGDGRGRPDGSARLGEDLLLHEVGVGLLGREAAPEQLAAELGKPVEEVREAIDQLVSARILERSEEASREAYAARGRWIDDDEWAQLSPAERLEISRVVARLINLDFDLALESGLLDARPDRHLTHLPLRLDERGWSELMKVHDDAFLASVRIGKEAAARLEESGEPPAQGISIQALFEVPRPDFPEPDEDRSPTPPAATERQLPSGPDSSAG